LAIEELSAGHRALVDRRLSGVVMKLLSQKFVKDGSGEVKIEPEQGSQI
jgi:hypothetical protein